MTEETKEKPAISSEFLSVIFVLAMLGIGFFIYCSKNPGEKINLRNWFYITSEKTAEEKANNGPNQSEPPLAPSMISRIITYHLEGNWEIDSTVKYRRQDNTTYDKSYHYRLIVQKEPPNSGVVIHFSGTTLKIVGLTKNGNEFTIQSESMIFVGDVLFEGRLIEKDKMEGTCHVAFTESRSKPTSMKFTGRRVDHFDIKSND